MVSESRRESSQCQTGWKGFGDTMAKAQPSQPEHGDRDIQQALCPVIPTEVTNSLCTYQVQKLSLDVGGL